MKRQTRELILNIAAGVAIAATAAVVLIPASVSAAPATATSNVNVRSGPGPNFSVVQLLRSGQTVDVGECRGSWCFVTTRGGDGWVSSSYLSGGGGGGGGGRGPEVIGPANPGLGINIGPGGVSIGIGNNPPPPNAGPGRPRPGNEGRPGRPGWDRPPPPPARVSEACFFDRSRYGGESFCMDEGESIRRLGAWADRVSSIENRDGLEITVCYEDNFRDCRTYTSSASRLGDFDDSIRSIQVR